MNNRFSYLPFLRVMFDHDVGDVGGFGFSSFVVSVCAKS